MKVAEDHTGDHRGKVTKAEYRQIRNRLIAHVDKRVKELEPVDQAARRHLAGLVDAVSLTLVTRGLVCDCIPQALRIAAEVIEIRDTYAAEPGLLVSH